MTLAALLDLGVPEEIVQKAVTSLGLPGELVVGRTKKQGLAAATIEVRAPHEHKHRHLHHIEAIIAQGNLSDGAKDLALRMFQRLAEAEAECHGIPIAKVHFHEVGAVDSIFDFVGVAVALDWLAIERFTSAPVPTGNGWVQCEHGLMPVPPPAVALLLRGVPLANTAIEGELTTPTGAAILTTLVKDFGPRPAMTLEKVGLGAGKRDLPQQANILRLMLGTEVAPLPRHSPENTTHIDENPFHDAIWQVETNLDDATPETLGYCQERLFAQGALDVYVIPILMKKNRPGSLLVALCHERDLPAVEKTLFRETSTFGVRKSLWQRSLLARKSVVASTPWGPIQGKLGWRDDVRVCTPEYDDCARVAREANIPLHTVLHEATECLRAAHAHTQVAQVSQVARADS